MRRKELAHWWRGHLDEDPAQRQAVLLKTQIDSVERFLGLEPRARVLDLACGRGRQTLELARRGYRVLGMDSPEGLLAEARKEGRAERLNVHFLKGDIRQIPYRSEFDAVVSLFGSFGCLAGERDDLKALESARKSLKPGAKLLLDLLNKEWLMRHFEPNLWEQGEDGRGTVVLDKISFDFEAGRLNNHRTLVAKDGTRSPAFVSLRVYTLTELKALLARAGLAYLGSWGGFEGSPYGMDSARMIVLAVKAPEAGRAHAREASPLVSAIRIKGRSKARR